MKLLDLKTVADRLKCSKGHVSKLINGKVKSMPVLPSVRNGRKRLVIETTLEEYVKNNETNGTDECQENVDVRMVRSRS